jgi:hypothetical protein
MNEQNGCDLRKIPKKKELERLNLERVTIMCSYSDKRKRFCVPKESYIEYKCRKGYKFANKRGKLIKK